MSRFKLSLRDLFIGITALCAQFGLLAIYLTLPTNGQDWLVTGLHAVSSALVPIAIAVVVADFRRHKPLLSGVLAFVAFHMLTAIARNNLIAKVVLALVGGLGSQPLYTLVVWCFAVIIGLVCAWITRSLSNPSASG
jgi:hypothetical protein